jgi:[acyl-carrier-protein] S-malonyltransferase
MTAVAWVAGAPLELSDVDDRERTVRSGPARAALPDPDSSEGRQLRRWLVQLMAAERLIALEPADSAIAPGLDEIAPDRAALLELGSVAASLLARNPAARAVFRRVTKHITVPPEQISRYHANNPEHLPESRTVRHAIMAQPQGDPRLSDRPLKRLRRGELVGPVQDAVFAAEPGATVGPIRDPLGWHVLRVEAVHPARTKPLDEVRDDIEARLLAGARRRAFTAWLDGRAAELVRLAPGYEHPGDPSQPDNTHRH